MDLYLTVPSDCPRVGNGFDFCWVRRSRKRQARIRHHKGAWLYEVWLKHSRVRALTPDPCDRNTSKRQWEYSIQDWLEDLRDDSGILSI